MKRWLLVWAAAVAAMLPLQAQSVGFEVASVKPSSPNPGSPLAGIPMILPALGRLTANNVTLKMLVMTAYDKQPFEIVGGPAWANSDKYDINAKADDPTLKLDALRERLKGLLAERFKLQAHVETREVPTYALVLARKDGKLGDKLKPSADNCPDFKEQQQKQLEAIAKGGLSAIAQMVGKPGETRPCSFMPLPATPGAIGMRASGQSLDTLTLVLKQLTGRPVVNKTGLTGLYDFDLVIDLQTLMQVYQQLGVNLPVPPNLPEGPSLVTQLQDDLGLKLDSQRGAGEVLVIDAAEHPAAD